MSIISLNSVSFQYGFSSEPVFTGLSLSIDTLWKTGLVGRDGRGKSTLLSLINGDLEPVAGSVDRSVSAALFPSPVRDPNALATHRADRGQRQRKNERVENAARRSSARLRNIPHSRLHQRCRRVSASALDDRHAPQPSARQPEAAPFAALGRARELHRHPFP